jgi:hypothetical protein
MKLVVVLLLACACACPSKSTSKPTTGSGSGSGSAATPPAEETITSCEGAKGKLGKLYRAELEKKDPKNVDELVADNTAMVLKDCKKAPDRVIPCLIAAQTVKDVETKCVVQLDDEGTEGEQPK